MAGRLTLAREVSAEGVTLHAGNMAYMRLMPAPSGAGIVFVRSDLGAAPVLALWSNVSETRLGTVLKGADGATIAVVEHLLAALSGAGIDDCRIEIDGPELPALDGDAAAFLMLIDRAGARQTAGAREILRVMTPVAVEAGSASAKLLPAASAELHCDIDFPSRAIGRQSYTFAFTEENFRRDIAPARTFGFLHEAEALRAKGFARGASYENTLVIDRDVLVNPEKRRFDDEFVRHKILDAIGDLKLAGAPLIARYEGIRPSHTLNNELLRKLFADPANYDRAAGSARPRPVLNAGCAANPKRTSVTHSPNPPRAYPDLHDHIAALEAAGQLIRVDRPINKDTEMHPLVRWQFRGGIAEKDRKAFLFTNVIDSKGKHYNIPVIVGGVAANREIYRIGLGCPLDQVDATWARAMANPIPPRIVMGAPCHDVMITRRALNKEGAGLDAIPVPISTPGWDNAPYTTLSQFITKDPDTGVQNVGNYRGQIKGRRRLGMNPSLELRPGIYNHWLKYKARGEKMPAAVVLGAPPAIAFVSAQKIPENLDEIAVAGGLVGSPINVTRGITVDLLIPAEAEIVIEGYIDTEYLEPEAPFGESHGHVNLQEYNAYMEVSAITRRSNAILTSIISQVTPSESSVIKRVSLEPMLLHSLRDALALKCVTRVSLHEPLTNLRKVVILHIAKNTPRTEVWRALNGLITLHRAVGKYVIAIDEDIDPENMDAVWWALSYRCNPALDVQIVPHRDQGHGPRSLRNNGEDACILFDATLKEPFPPISLPKREYMENARKIWEELGLPPLKPQAPWFGTSLGEWGEDFETMAQRAVEGDYWVTGDIIAQQRRNDVPMNTEIRRVKPKT